MAQGRWLGAAARLAGAHILREAGDPPVRIVLPDGTAVQTADGEARFTLRILTWRALAAMAADPETGFAEKYAAGAVEVEGALEEFCDTIYSHWPRSGSSGLAARLLAWYLDWTQRRSQRAAKKNIRRHYDLGNEFYRMWLDEEMLYTCAFFPSEEATLEEAQAAKMERVARKLGLEAGERVVDAGCGWGAFALYVARAHGCRVRAFNISEEQIAWARRRCRELGLEGRVEFVLDDYRNITGTYDAFASIGMLEHVGKEHYRDLGEVIRRTIGEKGRGLLHFIGRSRPAPLSAWIRKRIFPGAYAPALSEMLPLLEAGGYHVADIENLRSHYARTLRCWRERFEAAELQARAMYGEEFARAWKLYLAGSEASFRSGSLELYQVLFAGPRCGKKLWTRENWQNVAIRAGEHA
ncbi:MAG: SAM-dependent methyltransferase [Bryobacteraceae bacterium]|nr:MAG: SAM-dependent methyltransferase [Bryobacteraceae bacterium]